jgi:hypothetical protein
MFLKAAESNLLPYTVDQGKDLSVSRNGVLLSSPIGIGPYLSCNGEGIDGILEASGVDS